MFDLIGTKFFFFDFLLLWEALALLPIGISVNQLRSLPEGATTMAVPVAMGAYICSYVPLTL